MPPVGINFIFVGLTEKAPLSKGTTIDMTSIRNHKPLTIRKSRILINFYSTALQALIVVSFSPSP